jgi:uncharacterized protein
MQVPLYKRFQVPARSEAVWPAVRDLDCVVGCVPGATLTGRCGESCHNGTLAVRIGPALVHFEGPIEVCSVDEREHRVQLQCSARDTLGTSKARLDLVTTVTAAGERSSEVVGQARLEITGALAGFGAGVIKDVADGLMDGFALNLEARITGVPVAAGLAQSGGDAAMDGAGVVLGAVRKRVRRLLGGD